ncbi:hypothetical protein FOZ60_002770 [Perkinsus olseni]|uniref:Uncharacterized protein n=1 Tax=Perkinsus olseni TaxID=32597 RepID=A0A7J6NYD0_PEROL|nr:hypothetical protein FOZ60_002770 [Perkinsus olseni]
MINFMLTWLIAAQALVTTSAQTVGKFTHSLGPFDVSYVVNEDHEVSFVLSSNRPGLPNYHSFGPYPLIEVTPSTYTVDFKGAKDNVDVWYNTLVAYMIASGMVDPVHMPPLAGIKKGDLVTLTYLGTFTFTTQLRSGAISCELVSREMRDGVYVYKEAGDPSPFEVHFDTSKRSRGSPLHIWIGCYKNFVKNPFELYYYRTVSLPYGPYVLGSGSEGYVKDLFRRARQPCPTKHFDDNDFKKVIAVNERTIYATFAGATRALTYRGPV